MARVSAKQALLRATFMSDDCAEARRLIELSERSPTAMTVKRIISDKVTTSANPRFRSGIALWGRASAGFFIDLNI